MTVVRVGVAPVGVAPVNDNVEPVSAAELRLKKDQNVSNMNQVRSKLINMENIWIKIDQNGSQWIDMDQKRSKWIIIYQKFKICVNSIYRVVRCPNLPSQRWRCRRRFADVGRCAYLGN